MGGLRRHLRAVFGGFETKMGEKGAWARVGGGFWLDWRKGGNAIPKKGRDFGRFGGQSGDEVAKSGLNLTVCREWKVGPIYKKGKRAEIRAFSSVLGGLEVDATSWGRGG